MTLYEAVGHEGGGCCGSMKAALIGFLSTVVGLFFAIYVYVDTSDEVAQVGENLWARGEVITLLVAFILAILLLIVWIPLVLLDMDWCCCLSTVKATVVKAAFESKCKVVKIGVAVLSLIVFVLALVYLIHAEIVNKSFKNATSGAMTIVSVIGFLLNLIFSIIYLKQ